jgi:hypothetical protein
LLFEISGLNVGLLCAGIKRKEKYSDFVGIFAYIFKKVAVFV